jgi:uroporphyrinogen III methyltransferase/synthase
MRTLVLTQPRPRIDALALRIAAAGVDTCLWPMNALVEVDGLDWTGLARMLAGCRWALLPSPGAIGVAMGAFSRLGLSWPEGCGIGLIGPGSVEALAGWRSRVSGLDAAAVVAPDGPPYDADALLARDVFRDLAGSRVMVMRRSDGREAWLRTLAARGATVLPVSVYRARPLDPPADAAAWLAGRAAADTPFAVSVASAEAGRRLAAVVAPLACADWVRAQPVLTQHPGIGAALTKQGWPRVLVHAPGTAGLLGALESLKDDPP